MLCGRLVLLLVPPNGAELLLFGNEVGPSQLVSSSGLSPIFTMSPQMNGFNTCTLNSRFLMLARFSKLAGIWYISEIFFTTTNDPSWNCIAGVKLSTVAPRMGIGHLAL